jgi:ribose transport system permease protein
VSRNTAVVRRLYDLRIPILIAVLVVIFSALIKDFLSLETAERTLLLLPSDGVIAIGATLVMIMGEFDLSVGGIVAVTSLLLARFLPFGLGIAIVAAAAGGALIGLLNGMIIYRLRVNSVIATIAMGFVLSGCALLLSDRSLFLKNPTLVFLGNNALWIFPYSTLLYGAFTVLVFLVLKRTVFGLRMYAVGGSRVSSSYSGIDIERMGIAVFVLNGVFVAAGSVLLTARLSSASPFLGSETAIFVITAVLLGGMTIGGGNGDVVKTLLGMLLLSLMSKGFTQLQIPARYQNMIIGAVLILLLYIGKKLLERER